AGDAGGADQQPFAEFREAEARQPFLLGAVQLAQHAPLRAADTELGEVRLHDPFDQAEGADQFAESVLGRAGGGGGHGRLAGYLFSLLIIDKGIVCGLFGGDKQKVRGFRMTARVPRPPTWADRNGLSGRKYLAGRPRRRTVALTSLAHESSRPQRP